MLLKFLLSFLTFASATVFSIENTETNYPSIDEYIGSREAKCHDPERHHNCFPKNRIGPTGPTGPTGATGPTGPTGTFSSAFFVAHTTDTSSFDDSQALIFNITDTNIGGFILNTTTGVITLPQPGTYMITLGIYLDDTRRVQIFANGSPTSSGTALGDPCQCPQGDATSSPARPFEAVVTVGFTTATSLNTIQVNTNSGNTATLFVATPDITPPVTTAFISILKVN